MWVKSFCFRKDLTLLDSGVAVGIPRIVDLQWILYFWGFERFGRVPFFVRTSICKQTAIEVSMEDIHIVLPFGKLT